MQDPTDLETALAAQPETAGKIEEFLANPETGIRRERPARRLPDGAELDEDDTTQA